jgi:hypothetical protein
MSDSASTEAIQFGLNAPNRKRFTARWEDGQTVIKVATEDFTLRYRKIGNSTLCCDEYDPSGHEKIAHLADNALRSALEERGWEIEESCH